MSERIERIRALLVAALSPSSLDITDESHRHVGHAGARDGRGHFDVSIVSSQFAGLTSIERHRAVYAALSDLMVTDIHALSLQTRAPSEVLA